MSLPTLFKDSLRLPLIAAPMFLASGTELVLACCKAGIAGTFPALNQRTSEGFEEWLIEITRELKTFEETTGKKPAPYGVNLIVHKSNPRLQADLALCEKYKVPFVITSLGTAAEVVEKIHSYGGLVFHDVINARFARKAAATGVDGLICVTGGAGGHAGTLNPFALLAEIRSFFDKTILLAGCISTGQDIASAQMMGADFAYAGTRFINTLESLVNDAYRDMVIESTADDIVYTPKVSGVNASFMKASLINAGIDPADLRPKEKIDYGNDLSVDAPTAANGDAAKAESEKIESEKNAWSEIWSAGQGVAAIHDTLSVADLVSRLEEEYHAANARQQALSSMYLQEG